MLVPIKGYVLKILRDSIYENQLPTMSASKDYHTLVPSSQKYSKHINPAENGSLQHALNKAKENPLKMNNPMVKAKLKNDSDQEIAEIKAQAKIQATEISKD